jgi:antitoxin component YwqK of YwqJK toxin-antitoxin module
MIMKKIGGILVGLLVVVGLQAMAQGPNNQKDCDVVSAKFVGENNLQNGSDQFYVCNDVEDFELSQDGDLMLVTYHDDNGNITEKGTLKNGELHGKWISYNENGDVTQMAHYNNGKKDGIWFVWKDNGSTLLEIEYDNNELKGSHTWAIEKRQVAAAE